MIALNKYFKRSLKKCILEGFNGANGKFFYSFEITPKEGFKIELEKFQKLPLFVDLTWIGDSNLKSEISDSLALKMARSIEGTRVVNSLTCYKLTDQHIQEILEDEKVESLTILRGDKVDPNQKYKFANELIQEVRKRRNDVTILTAGYPEKHPEAKSIEEDIQILKRKIEAGADVVITQLTFSSNKFCTFVESCRKAGIPEDIPIIPGLYISRALDELDKILQITKTEIPQQFYDELKKLADCEVEFQELALTQTVTCIRDIQRDCSEFVRGFHFYTMNNLHMLQRLTHAIDFSEISSN